ncbi:MAG: hypothetical protein ABFS17_12225 [Chloroflexota bacterium]
MTHQIHPEPQDPPRGSAPQSAELSIMAVQELLGLFSNHQTHAKRTPAEPGQPATGLQHALQEKPLSYL